MTEGVFPGGDAFFCGNLNDKGIYSAKKSIEWNFYV